MNVSEFDYVLPKELIAHYPLKERDACRLMVVDRAAQTIRHAHFGDIAGLFRAGDVMVLNDTKVMPCRLKGKRATGGAVEALLVRHAGELRFEALLKPGRLKLHERVIFDGGLAGTVTGRSELSFDAPDEAAVYKAGKMPLPPYIKREPLIADETDYQTVYARHEGAIAAPTAGLHFTDGLLARMRARGVGISYITLHVGTGTFKPVKAGDIRRHEMDAERFHIPGETRTILEQRRLGQQRVIAVGTTAARALETFAQGTVEGETRLFIYPGYRFKCVDCLLTNFHLPKTTLYMLTCAFGGTDLVRKAYSEAIAQQYRFYSYGDAMLLI